MPSSSKIESSPLLDALKETSFAFQKHGLDAPIVILSHEQMQRLKADMRYQNGCTIEWNNKDGYNFWVDQIKVEERNAR